MSRLPSIKMRPIVNVAIKMIVKGLSASKNFVAESREMEKIVRWSDALIHSMRGVGYVLLLITVGRQANNQSYVFDKLGYCTACSLPSL